jgi:hypothetical protein
MVAKSLLTNGNIVSVGYMLRYLRCVQKMKQILHDNNLTVMATNARYVSDPVLLVFPTLPHLPTSLPTSLPRARSARVC